MAASVRTASEAPSVRTVLVIGAGTMGSGIAQVAAEAGFVTLLHDADAANLRRGYEGVRQRWERALAAGRNTREALSAAEERLLPSESLETALAEADLIIEAIVEKLDVKASLLALVDQAAKREALVASNTSSISITALGRASGRPDRFLGLHFFNPVPALPLVEVVRGLETSEDAVNEAVRFAVALGKTPVVVNDSPGFVANRILLPMINEAIFALQDGVATPDAIDEVMKLGMSHPMGPLALADLIGLDVCLDIMETLQRDFGDDKYRPAPLLRRMVAAGRLGRKSGRGFYTYGS